MTSTVDDNARKSNYEFMKQLTYQFPLTEEYTLIYPKLSHKIKNKTFILQLSHSAFSAWVHSISIDIYLETLLVLNTLNTLSTLNLTIR